MLPEMAQRITSCVDRLGGQTKAAKLIGVSQPGLRNWMIGAKLPQSFEQIARLAEEAGASLDWLITGRERDTGDLKWLPRLDGGAPLPFAISAVAGAVTSIESAAVHIVEEREMETYIMRGDAVIVDRGDRDLLKSDGGVYLLRRAGGHALMRASAEFSGEVRLWSHSDPTKQRFKGAALAAIDVVGRVPLGLLRP